MSASSSARYEDISCGWIARVPDVEHTWLGRMVIAAAHDADGTGQSSRTEPSELARPEGSVVGEKDGWGVGVSGSVMGEGEGGF